MPPIVGFEEVRKSQPKLSLGQQSDQSEFTGERFLPGYKDGSIELQHVHRYSFALPYVLNQTVLDIACGEGYGSHLLSQVACTVTGVDIDEPTIDLARQRYSRPNLSFEAGSATQIPLADHSVDVVVSFETIEHFSDHHAFWSEVKRVLKPSGTLIISSPNRDVYNDQRELQNPFHACELSQQELVQQLKHRFAHHQLLLQSTVFGSSLVPALIPQTVISLDSSTGELHWKTGAEVTNPYSVAIASDEPTTEAGQSIYTGHYPEDAMSAMAGGILERDMQILALRRQVSEAGTNLIEKSRLINAARQTEEELRTTVETLIKKCDDVSFRLLRTQENLSERETTVNALMRLLDKLALPQVSA